MGFKLKGKYKSILQFDEYCFACGARAKELEVHHVFNKHNKKRSEKYGLMIYLCRDCHRIVHDTDNPLRRRIESYAQSVWELNYGDRVDFILKFNKNYAL